MASSVLIMSRMSSIGCQTGSTALGELYDGMVLPSVGGTVSGADTGHD